jgi:hypothetical protein
MCLAGIFKSGVRSRESGVGSQGVRKAEEKENIRQDLQD